MSEREGDRDLGSTGLTGQHIGPQICRQSRGVQAGVDRSHKPASMLSSGHHVGG